MRSAFSLISILAFAVQSCKNGVYLTAYEPPVVFVPKNILAVGVINRSLSKGEGKVTDIIDAALTAESPELDKTGSTAATQGCLDELVKMNRFERIVLLDSMPTDKPIPESFPTPLTWEEVDKICTENDVQILFVLETYDTDTRLNYSSRNVNVAGPMGTQIPMIEHHVQMTTDIKQGWRIYLPESKTIIDQFFIGDTYNNSSVGINPVKAAEGLINRKEVVRKISESTGHRYATRIRSVPFRVYRHYYKKGSPGIKQGHRRALSGDWEGAGEKWKAETNSPKRKVAGRACHNMAIIEEINGNIESAIEWAQKAYGDYGTKESLSYSRILLDRKARIDRMNRLSDEDSKNDG